MDATMRIIPKTGLIRDPKTGKRLVKGKAVNVPQISYWLKRLKEGDVAYEQKQPEEKKSYKEKPVKKEKKKSGGFE